MKYYILKQFYPGAEIWVLKLNDEDTAYSYDTLEEAETALPEVQTLYPENICKISTTV
jgi:hypothetical protein